MANETTDRERLPEAFWPWFRQKGVRDLLWRRATVFHVVVGAALAFWSGKPLADLASVVVLPLAGVLMGLTFAWAGNLSSIMGMETVRLVARGSGGDTGRLWIHKFQLQTLVVLCVTVLWGMCAMGLKFPELLRSDIARAIARTFVFASTSIAIREAWSVIYGVNRLLQMDRRFDQELNAPDVPDDGAEAAASEDAEEAKQPDPQRVRVS